MTDQKLDPTEQSPEGDSAEDRILDKCKDVIKSNLPGLVLKGWKKRNLGRGVLAKFGVTILDEVCGHKVSKDLEQDAILVVPGKDRLRVCFIEVKASIDKPESLSSQEDELRRFYRGGTGGKKDEFGYQL